MPRHLTVNDETVVCGPYLGELAGDSYTTDADQMDCMDCDALLGRPQDALAAARAHGQGYADGKEKAYFELENWRPVEHQRGCGCELCRLARGIVNQVLGQKTWK